MINRKTTINLFLLIAFTGVLKSEELVTKIPAEQQLAQEIDIDDDTDELSRLEKVKIYAREAIDVARYLVSCWIRKVRNLKSTFT